MKKKGFKAEADRQQLIIANKELAFQNEEKENEQKS